MPGFLDYLDDLDTQLLRLKVEGTAVEPLLNARAIVQKMRELLAHERLPTGEFPKLEPK